MHKPHDRSKYSRGYGGKVGSGGEVKHYNDRGIFYPGGLGCTVSDNCFECPALDCNYSLNPHKPDVKFIANRGNGIKVW